MLTPTHLQINFNVSILSHILLLIVLKKENKEKFISKNSNKVGYGPLKYTDTKQRTTEIQLWSDTNIAILFHNNMK